MNGWWQKLCRIFKSNSKRKLFVVAAPSGAGKTSLVKALIERNQNLTMSVSYTTRAQRETEILGRDYWFVTIEAFELLKKGGDLLEHAKVFDNYYGTGQSQIEKIFDSGKDVILEIDWQGARQVRQKMPQSQSIFILPPSRAALEQRLRGRSTDSAEIIQRRLQDSVADMSHWSEFDFVVVNDDFGQAIKDLTSIVTGHGEAFRSDRSDICELLDRLISDSTV